MKANLTRGNSITESIEEYWEREIEYCANVSYYYKKYYQAETATRYPEYHKESPTLNLFIKDNVQFHAPY